MKTDELGWGATKIKLRRVFWILWKTDSDERLRGNWLVHLLGKFYVQVRPYPKNGTYDRFFSAGRETCEEIYYVTLCCGYKVPPHLPHPVYWNPGNAVVQCHNCGQVWEPKK